jgi:hypothetical protein
MLWTCKRVQNLLESDDRLDMPEWAEKHLQSCSHCLQVAEGAVDYQHLLRTARSEPVPASRLEWSQVRAHIQLKSAHRTTQWVPRLVAAGSIAVMLLVGITFTLSRFPGESSAWVLDSSQPEKTIASNQPDATTLPNAHKDTTRDNSMRANASVPERSSSGSHLPESSSVNHRIANAMTPTGKLSQVRDEKPDTPLQARERTTANGYAASSENGLETGTRLEVAFAPSVTEEANNFYFGLDSHPTTDALPLPSIRCEGADANYLQVNYVSEANEAYAF